MKREDISDEEAIEHFRKRFMRIPEEERKRLKVIVGKKVYSFDEILRHMKERSEIGKIEIEIEKEYMRWLSRRKR
ncbi:MAG: hypothetical protein DRN13_03225 [Thermoplasmata archaeon]|nr:MAG: hypothetical protein DRN13_03225 [Thermoplasmata archaeon]HDO69192.1 hypothetical protein [Thermoplasmatales archaeon]HEX17107.1 hypothetical protein [Thermoplasmatales archaeon]